MNKRENKSMDKNSKKNAKDLGLSRTKKFYNGSVIIWYYEDNPKDWE